VDYDQNSETPIETPAATCARIELPGVEAVRRLGLEMEVDEARLVATCLSCVIAKGRSKTRNKIAQLTSGLVACCRVEGVRDGVTVPAAHPELAAFGWPAGATALRQLGIDHRTLEGYWARARTRATDACLPLPWLVAFVPAPLWQAVLTLIKWGPAEAGMRLEDAVIELAQQPIAIANRRRPNGARVSAGTINTRVTAVHQLFDAFVTLRGQVAASANSGLPTELLAQWTHKPARPDVELCGAEWARVDTSGPSFEQARTLLHRVHTEVQAAPARSRYLRLRRRTVAGLLLAHGQRVEALRMLNVDDYVPEHNFGDGSTGPALVYRPGKTRAADETHILALPRELADWLEEWICSTTRSIDQPGSPMWPARKPKPGQPIARINASAFERAIGGHAAKDGTGSLPLLPRGDDRYHGFNPHSYRHSCYQAAKRAGAQAKLEQPHGYAHIGPDDFARAVVGHDLIRGVGDFYRDLDQQHLARVAIEIAWRELRDQPIEYGPDPDAINEVSSRLELLAATITELEAELVAIDMRQAELDSQRTKRAATELETAILESNTLVFRLAGLQRDLATTGQRRDQARTDLEQATSGQAPIDPDDATYGERLACARARAKRTLVTTRRAPTGELSVKEVAEILDVTRQTIGRWIRSSFATQTISYWAPGAWTRTPSGSWTIPTAEVKCDSLTAIQHERLLIAELRRTHSSGLRDLCA
jgi:integrase